MLPSIRPSFALIAVVLLALFAVEIPARVVEDVVIDPSVISAIAEPMVRQARQQSTATVTVLKTTTISSVTTTVLTTKKICGIIASVSAGTVNPGGITTFTNAPAAACSRRRRQYWDQPVFVALKNDDDTSLQYFRLNPTQVLNFEPTLLPQFRNTHSPSVKLVKESSFILPSFDKPSDNIRVASPIFGNGISSLISSIVSGILTTTTTTTSIITAYTSTSVSTSYTGTASYYVVGACYPAGLTTC
ncbi:hypothetical protein DAPPUDRAFT_306165 [Daphnia pulex]|uniref:Uncharacterized protein n=1 Tax=Daphnia pulex TaxID=6669 RepID=E9GVH3_DAPPU|nr:hypothetical protein DAPPUDRAFT_306165 [Daphnia pulex]|eukprot:EFX76415.1 hypothetical protein DAPPUDRAFT_306165 [Daphnia pulex]